MIDFLEALEQYQQDNKLSDRQLAKRLGIDHSTLSYVKSGKRNPGMRFYKAVANAIPELYPAIYEEIFNIPHFYPEKPPSQNLGIFRRLYDGFYRLLK